MNQLTKEEKELRNRVADLFPVNTVDMRKNGINTSGIGHEKDKKKKRTWCDETVEMKVITSYMTTRMLNRINKWKELRLFASRSEFIRCALFFFFIEIEKIYVDLFNHEEIEMIKEENERLKKRIKEYQEKYGNDDG